MKSEFDTENYIEAVFAKNKALFGDAVMLDTSDGGTSTEDEKPAEDGAPAEESTTEEKPEEKPSEDGGDPEWAKKELTKVRAEAANYRTRLRDAEAKLSEAKTPEEFEAAVADLREENAKLEKSILVTKVAAKHGLSDVLAARLVGSTEEELEADAKLLASVANAAPPAPESLEGGLDPSSDDDGETDPRKLAARFRRI